MSRVESKNLFNFVLTGVLDDDVIAADAKIAEHLYQSEEGMKMMEKMGEALSKDDADANMEFLKLFRGTLANIMSDMMVNPILEKSAQNVIKKEIKVPTSHNGTYDVPVFVYTPKNLEGNTKQVAYIYAHGGGSVAGDASMYQNILCHYAVECGVIVFNVDYRLAPETKCPNNVKDYYEVIKYVHKNADTLGIDSSKIVMGGESGGGYICLGAEVILAQHDESHLVKLAIPSIAMTDDYHFSDPGPMTSEENENNLLVRKMWHLIAADFESQKNDPLLFPGKSSSELLEKFPPTIIEESEFDMFLTETSRLANRLRRAGRLLEFVTIPGGKHGSTLDPRLKNFKVAMDAKKMMFQHYVHN